MNATNVVAMVSLDAENVAVMVMSCAMNATDVEEFDVHGAMAQEETECVFTVQVLGMIQTIGSVSFVKVLANRSASPAMAMAMMIVTSATERES